MQYLLQHFPSMLQNLGYESLQTVQGLNLASWVLFKWQFPVSLQKLKLFNQAIMNAVQGEEIVINKTKQKLFTNVRKLFNEWETSVNDSALKGKYQTLALGQQVVLH